MKWEVGLVCVAWLLHLKATMKLHVVSLIHQVCSLGYICWRKLSSFTLNSNLSSVKDLSFFAKLNIPSELNNSIIIKTWVNSTRHIKANRCSGLFFFVCCQIFQASCKAHWYLPRSHCRSTNTWTVVIKNWVSLGHGNKITGFSDT